MHAGTSALSILSLRKLIISLAMLFLTTHAAEAGGFNSDAKISLHLVAITGNSAPSCALSPIPPCNAGQDNLLVHGLTNTDYFLYVLLQDGDRNYGFNSVEFAIRYNDSLGSGVDIQSWLPCGDLNSESPDWFESSGSSTKITWVNCQHDSLPGDIDGRPSAVVGVFRVSAYSPDAFTIAPLFRADADSSVLVSACPGVFVELDNQRALGKVGFGTAPGYDPCEGPWSPFGTFQDLNSTETASLQIKLSSMYAHFSQSIILQGGAASDELGLFVPFLHAAFYFPNDQIYPERIKLSNDLLNGILTSLASVPVLTDGAFDPSGVMGLQMVATHKGTVIGFEAVVDSATTSEIVSRIREALGAKFEVKSELDRLACEMGVYDGPPAQDVTESVKVLVKSLRLQDPETLLFHGKMTLTNVSTSTIHAPITLALRGVPGIQVLSPLSTGNNLCGTLDYALYEVSPTKDLDPNHSLKLDLKLTNISNEKLDWRPIVYSGDGVRSVPMGPIAGVGRQN